MEDNRSEKFSDIYGVYIHTKKSFIGGQSITKENVNYGGKIYCVTVPSGALVVRRNNIAAISGNSGDPKTIILQILDILWTKFGGTINDKGYKVLDSHVRVIQGDGVNYDSIKEILEGMKEQKYSVDNIAFGMGGALLQKLDRDTQKFAFKCSSIRIDGIDKGVYKNPITDSNKISKSGRLKLVAVEGNNGKFKLYTIKRGISQEKDVLQEVFLNGNITKEYTLDEIRKNSKG